MRTDDDFADDDDKEATTGATIVPIRKVPGQDWHPMSARWPDAVRNVAFELWFVHCDRSIAKTGRALAVDAPDPSWRALAGISEGEPGPGADAIGAWKKRDQWDERAVDKMREQAPWSMGAAAVKYAVTTNRAAEVLAELLEESTNDDSTRLKAAMFFLQPIREGLTMHLQMQQKVVGGIGDLSGLSMEELAERERQIIEKKVV